MNTTRASTMSTYVAKGTASLPCRQATRLMPGLPRVDLVVGDLAGLVSPAVAGLVMNKVLVHLAAGEVRAIAEHYLCAAALARYAWYLGGDGRVYRVEARGDGRPAVTVTAEAPRGYAPVKGTK